MKIIKGFILFILSFNASKTTRVNLCQTNTRPVAAIPTYSWKTKGIVFQTTVHVPNGGDFIAHKKVVSILSIYLFEYAYISIAYKFFNSILAPLLGSANSKKEVQLYASDGNAASPSTSPGRRNNRDDVCLPIKPKVLNNMSSCNLRGIWIKRPINLAVFTLLVGKLLSCVLLVLWWI